MHQNLNNIKIRVTDNFDMIWRYADGYLEAGNILLNLLIDPKRYDFYPKPMKESIINIEQQEQIFPILFLYRQYIELSIKGLYMKYCKNKNEYKKIMEHSLENIWEKLKSKIFELNIIEEIEFDECHLEEINNIIGYFIQLDNDSFKFRYPFSKEVQNYFKKDEKIDLKDLSFKITFFSIFVEEALS